MYRGVAIVLHGLTVGDDREDYSSSTFRGTVIGGLRHEKGTPNLKWYSSSPPDCKPESQNVTNGGDVFSGSMVTALLRYFLYRTFRYWVRGMNYHVGREDSV
jgi:hypothetical protein